MKNWLPLVGLFLVTAFTATAQDSAKTAGITYKTIHNFPGFAILKTDSSRTNSASAFHKGTPTVIIYFSPTCSHCQHQAEEITGNMKNFKNVAFLFVSSYSMEDIKQFVATYALDHFSNIMVAQDPGFNMGSFFELRSLPGIFVYDKKGQLKTHFETNVLSGELLAALQL